MTRARAIAGTMLILGAAAFASPASAAPERVWDFRVFLDDAPIGQHRFVKRDREGASELTSDARFNVKVLGFNAYRYTHEAKEEWRAGCLTGLTARTDDNGEQLAVKAVSEGGHLKVVATRARSSLDGCVMTFAYWDPAILRQSRLLNAQSGEYEAVKITQLGQDKLTVRGADVTATHYRITGSKHPIDLWYSAQHEWLALESPLDGGRRLRYRLP